MLRRSGLALTFWAALAGAGPAVEAPGPVAELFGTYDWSEHDPMFGGMSAIDVEADGIGFIALSDRGAILSARFIRDADGRIVGVKADPIRPLRGRGEDPLPKPRADSEGLAVAPDGTIYVSFEIAPRVLRYDALHGSATFLPIPRDFNRMRANGALEALAIAPDGALYTLPEVTVRRDGAYPVYRFRDGRWDQPFLLPPQGDYRPVSADFGPDGRLYLLLRSFGVRGFATKVQRFTVTGNTIDEGETLIDTRRNTFGNLEGLSVWRDAGGQLRITMIADDNFHSFLATQIVEFTVPD